MSSSFLSRLDDASDYIKAETKDITPVKTGRVLKDSKPSKAHAEDSYAAARVDSLADDDYGLGVGLNLDDSADSKDEEESKDLVFLCAEYIFDLFDANMLEDYHTIANFENRAIDAFKDPESTEISFDQERLHKEFLVIFEGLIAKFLKQKNATPEIFYAQVQNYLQEPQSNSTKRSAKRNRDAMEVVDVIFNYTDLSMWCEAMRDRAKLRAKYLKRQSSMTQSGGIPERPKTQIEEAAERVGIISPAKTHRFDRK